MIKAMVKWIKRIKAAWVTALALVATTGGNFSAIRQLHGSRGAISIDTIIYIFVAVVILYQLIPTVSTQNQAVQTHLTEVVSGNTTANISTVSTMGKFAAGLGEWLFPLFGILALVFLLWSKRTSDSGTKT